MAVFAIPWKIGTGSIYVNEVNGVVSISSDPNNLFIERAQQILFSTSKYPYPGVGLLVRQSPAIAPKSSDFNNDFNNDFGITK